MNNGQNIHSLGFDTINDPVVFVEQLAHIAAFGFRYVASAFR